MAAEPLPKEIYTCANRDNYEMESIRNAISAINNIMMTPFATLRAQGGWLWILALVIIILTGIIGARIALNVKKRYENYKYSHTVHGGANTYTAGMANDFYYDEVDGRAPETDLFEHTSLPSSMLF